MATTTVVQEAELSRERIDRAMLVIAASAATLKDMSAELLNCDIDTKFGQVAPQIHAMQMIAERIGALADHAQSGAKMMGDFDLWALGAEPEAEASDAAA